MFEYSEDHESDASDDSDNDEEEIISSGTAGLISTFRKDSLVCLITTAHEAKSLNGGVLPGIGEPIYINSDIYMNYLGTDSISQNTHYTKIKSYKKGFLSVGILGGYVFEEDSTTADIALLLIERTQLPVSDPVAVGYTTDNNNEPDSSYYMLSHAHFYPQLLSNNLAITGKTPTYWDLQTALPDAAGHGSSGALLIKKPSNALSPWYACGVQSSLTEEEIHLDTEHFVATTYSTKPRITRIDVLASAIKKYCWQGDSAKVSLSGSYKIAQQIDNTSALNPYTQERSFTAAADLTSSTGTTSKPIGSAVQSSYTKCSTCNLGAFAMPVTYPGNNRAWKAVIVAPQQINVYPGFSFDATGQSELHLSSVIIGSTTSTISKSIPINISGNRDSLKAENFVVYPNPSGDGVFYISFPGSAAGGLLTLSSMEGKQIYKGNMGNTNPYKLELSSLSKGTYVLNIYHPKTGEILFNKLIVYR
jgi:hypothetical protein